MGVSGVRYTGWHVNGYDRPAAVSLVRAGYGPLVATVLSSRGVRDTQTADDFLNAGPDSLPDPMDMPGMRAAAERLRLAVERRERVAVFGDYDVDGITAGCLMRDYLRSKDVPCLLIIPECREDGYGLSQKSVDRAVEYGASLAVTVDCGITSVAEAEYAATKGLELIVTDHHECGAELPKAVAVADPKIPQGDFPDKSLAGVGVAFMLACACEGRGAMERLLETYGDLVALGTVADVMPVTGANRVLIKRGIELIRQGKRPGIARLALEAGTDIAAMTASGIGFTLAPRLNAAGRMGQTSLAVRLVSAETEEEAAGYAQKLCELNASRREIESGMFEEALRMAQSEPESPSPIVLSSEHWYLGVAGIVASRLADRLSRPAVVICVSDGVGRGSCRRARTCGFCATTSDR